MDVQKDVKYILDHGYKRENIAVKLGMSAGAVYYWLNGRSKPSKPVQEKIHKMAENIRK